MIDGLGFEAGAARTAPTSVIDIAPTVLRHLDLPTAGVDGRALQRPARCATMGVVPEAAPNAVGLREAGERDRCN
jgi:arylsulfatase A-like enzyme